MGAIYRRRVRRWVAGSHKPFLPDRTGMGALCHRYRVAFLSEAISDGVPKLVKPSLHSRFGKRSLPSCSRIDCTLNNFKLFVSDSVSRWCMEKHSPPCSLLWRSPKRLQRLPRMLLGQNRQHQSRAEASTHYKSACSRAKTLMPQPLALFVLCKHGAISC